MKNILFIIDSLGIGGAEKALLSQAEEFYALGYSITCVTIYDHIQFDIPPYIQLLTLNWKNYKVLKYKRNSKKLYSLIDDLDREFSVILVHLDKAINLMKHYTHPKIYNVVHNNITQQDIAKRVGIKKRLKLRNTRKLYCNLNLITVSKGIERDLINNIQIKPNSIQTIYNSIDIEGLKVLSIEKNIVERDNYIVCVGRLVKQKRHDILLKAFKKSKLDTTLVLVGDGEDKDEIVELIKELSLEDRVLLTGFTKNPYPIIKSAKLLLLTSEYEGFGIVLVEALMLNTPIISTDCPSGPNEILIDKYNAYLTEVNDIEAISNKLKVVYSNSYNIEKRLYEKFERSNITKQYLRLINA